jgi:membrane protein
MKEKRSGLTGIVQRLYITWTTFTANNMNTYATAGAYSFLLSALPIVLMVIAILIRVVHASPAFITRYIASNDILAKIIDANGFLSSIQSIHALGIVEIILGISIFWMARSFFTSLQSGMATIYRKRGKGKLVKDNLLVIAAEVILIALIVAMAIFVMSGNVIFRTLVQEGSVPSQFVPIARSVIRYLPFSLIIIFLFFVYYTIPRTKPRWGQSLFASLACALSFSLLRLLFASFVNMTRYNLVYGILSNVIVVLLEVYLFFFLFFFFAQFQYVTQFFESFLLAKLYLLPSHDDANPVRQFERMLFVEPPYFRAKYERKETAGQTIFRRGDSSTELYYVWEGTIRLEMPGQVIDLGKGSMFGEFSSIIGGNRTATAITLTDCVLLMIPASIFQETVDIDGDMSRRTLQMIADHLSKTRDGLDDSSLFS